MSINYGMKDGKFQTYITEDEEFEEELELEENSEEEEKSEEGITLSEKHGLNVSQDMCILCGECHSLVLFGKLPDDAEAPKQVCLGNVCQKCIEKLSEEKERVFIEMKDSGPTGRYAKVPDLSLLPEFLEEYKEERVFHVLEEEFNKIFKNEQRTDSESN